MGLIETRLHQLFPVLDASQIETARRFGSTKRAAAAVGEGAAAVAQIHTVLAAA